MLQAIQHSLSICFSYPPIKEEIDTLINILALELVAHIHSTNYVCWVECCLPG